MGQTAAPGSVALAPVSSGAKLAQRALLDLADPLGAQAHPLPDLAQRLLRTVEPVAGAQDHPLAIVHGAQQRPDLLDLRVIQQLVISVGGERIDEQLPKYAQPPFAAAQRLLDRLRDTLE